MKLSIFLMGDRDGMYHDIAAQVRQADELGFWGVWLAERHFANGDLLWPAPRIAAAYFAAQTRRIRIGLAACILPFHHPLHVAADTVTLDLLSRGRFDLGVTRGSMDEASHAAFGVSREEARLRFDEQLEIVRLACRGEPFSFRGRYYDLERIVPSPPPIQRPHPPLYVVTNSPSSLDAAADAGLPALLNGALDLDALARSAVRYAARSAVAGCSSSGADLLVNRFVFVAESNAAAHRLMRDAFLEFLETRAPDLRGFLTRTHGAAGIDYDFLAREICIFGDAAHCAARLLELYRRTGIEHVMCTFNLITLDHRHCVESMERFARDVMPRLAADSRAHTPAALAM
jgi:alkanesulfonate monooxygenase SsuD/methylene tetrahydromethanopterin reductase-like flavin-dependent oxidoreductase (luciferase family)